MKSDDTRTIYGILIKKNKKKEKEKLKNKFLKKYAFISY